MRRTKQDEIIKELSFLLTGKLIIEDAEDQDGFWQEEAASALLSFRVVFLADGSEITFDEIRRLWESKYRKLAKNRLSKIPAHFLFDSATEPNFDDWQSICWQFYNNALQYNI